MPDIIPIVEGHGEVTAVPVLLKRILQSVAPDFAVGIADPIRKKRNQIVKPEELEKALWLARRTCKNAGAILVILDADDDVPCNLGPKLQDRAKKETPLPVSVVLAQRMFESWFLGAKESLRGIAGIKLNASNVPNPESIGRVKKRLQDNMLRGQAYNPILHQKDLAEQMDILMARQNCPSFDKLIREVERLVREMKLNNP